MSMNTPGTSSGSKNKTEPPQKMLKIEESIEDVKTEEGSTAVFEGKIDGNPQPVICWFKDGTPVITDDRIKITTHMKSCKLEISEVRLKDHGLYTLVCTNSVKQLSVKAVLYVAPKALDDAVLYLRTVEKISPVRAHIRPVQVKVGGKIVLQVVFQNEVLTYRWFKNYKMIHNDHRITIIESSKSCNLTILEAEPTDSGCYSVVGLTKHGLVSSLGEVEVYDNKLAIEQDIPYINEELPEEIDTYEGEEVKLVCKATVNLSTSIKWMKKGVPIDKENYTPEDYGNHYIGLKISKPSKDDTAEYSVIVKDMETGQKDKSSCCLEVHALPEVIVAPVEVTKPLDTVLACCGSKIIFDCSFALENPEYFYVVWSLGSHRIIRSSNQFEVICKAGYFLLYVKTLEPGMAGEVVCELRQVVSSTETICVARSVGHLSIVPPTIIQRGVKRETVLKPKLYNETNRAHGIGVTNKCFYDPLHCRCQVSMATSKPIGSDTSGTSTKTQDDVILEIFFCGVEDDGLFYMRAVRENSSIAINRVTAEEKLEEGPRTVIIKWIFTNPPVRPTWYIIEMAQDDGSYAEVGVTSSPQFEIQTPPLGKLFKFRIKIAEPVQGCSESNVCLIPALQDEKPTKPAIVGQMIDYEKAYTKTGQQIGKGAFGEVVLVKNSEGKFFAAKVIKTLTEKKRQTAMRESTVMQQIQHPKLVELTATYVGHDSFVLVMEYLWGKELFARIVEEEHIKEVDVIPYVRQICEGLQYLHAIKIVHLDIKPENIVCMSPNSTQIKIIDFGLARTLKEGLIVRALYGTKDYMAPEVVNYDRLTVACDMWSLGVVTYTLLSGVLPFTDIRWVDRAAKITVADYNYNDPAFRDISDLAKNFVNKLLVRSVPNRMTAKIALQHEWIKGPLNKTKAGDLKKTRSNLITYLLNSKARWQIAGNVLIAAQRLRNLAVGPPSGDESGSSQDA